MKKLSSGQVLPAKKSNLIGLFPVHQEKQVYEIQYMHKSEAKEFDNLTDCLYHVFNMEDDFSYKCASVTLPNGKILQWNAYLANAFVSKERITESQFIEACELKVKEVHHA